MGPVQKFQSSSDPIINKILIVSELVKSMLKDFAELTFLARSY